MSKSSPPSKRSGVRVLGIAFLIVFLLLAGVALVVYFGWSGRPAYWNQQQERIAAMTPTQREAISTSFRNRLLTQWSDPGQGAVNTADDLFGRQSTIEIPYEDLNIWMAQEGVEMLSEIGINLPSSVKGAMVDTPGNGLLRITCDFNNGQVQQLVALSFDIKVSKDGTVSSTLQEATAGKLPLPTETAIDMIAKRAGGTSNGMLVGMMRGTPVGPIQIPIDASDTGRDGRLIGLDVKEDALVITRETVRRKPANQ